jgi:YVTN family beta-propeller protein
VHTSTIVFNPVTRKVYAVDKLRSEVAIIDTTNDSVARVRVGAGPVSIAVNERSGRVYVVSAATGTVSVIDGSSNALVTTVKVVDRPYSLAVNSATGKVYVSHTFSNKTSVIDGATNTTEPLTTGSIDLIAVDPQTDRIYLLSYEGGALGVLNGSRSTIERRNAGKHAWGMALNPVTHELYVARVGTSDVIAVGPPPDADTVIPAGKAPVCLAINAKTNTIYAGNYTSGDVTVIDGKTHRATTTVRVGAHPQAIAVDEVRNLVFVANTMSNTVTVIDGATNRSLATLPAGRSPYALAVNPGGSQVYVANGSGEDAFTRIDLSGVKVPAR